MPFIISSISGSYCTEGGAGEDAVDEFGRVAATAGGARLGPASARSTFSKSMEALTGVTCLTMLYAASIAKSFLFIRWSIFLQLLKCLAAAPRPSK